MKKQSDRITLDKETLYQLYIVEKLSIPDIVRKTEWSTGYISNKIGKYGLRRNQIKVQIKSKLSIDIDDNILIDEYINKKTKVKDIATLLNVSVTTIHNKIKELGLEKRNKTDLLKDLSNRRFGSLTVIKFSGEYTKIQERLWLCQCDCGKFKKVRTSKLLNWEVMSCGKSPCKATHPGGKWAGYQEIYGSHWSTIKRSARDRDIDVNVTIQEIWELFLKQERKCALTGEVLTLGPKGSGKNNSASLDRIDSEEDYNINNIQWIHKRVNRMKGDMDQKEFIKLCGIIWEYSKWQLEEDNNVN